MGSKVSLEPRVYQPITKVLKQFLAYNSHNPHTQVRFSIYKLQKTPQELFSLKTRWRRKTGFLSKGVCSARVFGMCSKRLMKLNTTHGIILSRGFVRQELK